MNNNEQDEIRCLLCDAPIPRGADYHECDELDLISNAQRLRDEYEHNNNRWL